MLSAATSESRGKVCLALGAEGGEVSDGPYSCWSLVHSRGPAPEKALSPAGYMLPVWQGVPLCQGRKAANHCLHPGALGYFRHLGPGLWNTWNIRTESLNLI